MKRQKNIECEIRGCITQSDFNEIKVDIEKDWGKLDESPELAIFFKGHDMFLKINKNGGVLTIKKTVDKKTKSKQETEFKFGLDSVPDAIQFLVQLGFDKGLFSYCYRYEAKKVDQSISVKFDTKIGDIFEIDEVVPKEADFSKVYDKLIKIANKYALSVWSQGVYKKIIQDSWMDVKTDPLVIAGNLHPLIQKVIRESKKNRKRLICDTRSIASIIRKRSNDYTELQKLYKTRTGVELLSYKHAIVKDYDESVSIIIPTFNSLKTLKLTLRSIERQILHKNQRKCIEVIVVDDGSEDRTESCLRRQKFKFKLKFLRQNNLGRAYARNLGASIAQGNILIFLDSDVILEKHFLNEHISKQHYLNDIVLISFKQNIPSNDLSIKDYFNKNKNLNPDITKDFRFEKIVKRNWLRTHRHVRNIEVRKVKIIEETDNLKNFGKDKVLGIWDLPTMSVTIALSLKKESFDRIGGFNLQFNGWGMEDTFLGACLIADGNYIIPCFSTGVFHIEHSFRSGSQKKRISEFNRNVLVYLDLINKPLNQIFKNINLRRK